MTNKKRFYTTNLEEKDDENSKVAPVERAESFPGIRLDRNQTTMGTKSVVASSVEPLRCKLKKPQNVLSGKVA